MNATIPRVAARGVVVVVFWIAAALLVIAAAGVTLKIVAVVGAAFAYMRLATRTATIEHALGVGVAWLVLDIVAEVVTASMVGHGWFELIGSPAKPALRDLMLVIWIVAPAVFARYRAWDRDRWCSPPRPSVVVGG